MSGKLPAIKPRELIRALERAGWQLDRVRGSHYIMVHPEEHRAVPVPHHNRDLKTGTLASILRSTGISRDELRRLL
jgi:predicted RNA binding protein YcfA (HicA-like mRNA interferase family)